MNKIIYTDLKQFNELLYVPLLLNISTIHPEKESQEYNAARFHLGTKKIIFRTAKITPTKIGQFVTLWKRQANRPIEPFNEADDFDFVIINTKSENNLGQFIFPKSILANKGVISNQSKEGKRALRVYPPWDNPTSKQAMNTQKWQNDYFIQLHKTDNKHQIERFYSIINTNDIFS